ncbi:MAG: DUF5702 domain-containing protein [Huintestinicola sp.]|uniref:DUF5702 domain-containing protein n=1 Tax=Huintestinicola sp. TaxID=2981661 RepID=UPI003EFD45DE
MKIREKLELFKFFWKENTRGGVTVFICLVLIPVLMFSGLMIDFARIKLYHAEAAAASYSYADAVLSQYDEMLYDVYGLLAVTQNDEALAALDVIKEYMASAYDPASKGKTTNASRSDLQYIPNNVVFIGKGGAPLESLWAPYGNTKMILDSVCDRSKSDCDPSNGDCDPNERNGANLSNPKVFADEVCDYMKIIGPADLAWNGILDAVDQSKQAQQNKELMKKRKEVDDNYNKLDDKLKKMYDKLCDINKYTEWTIPDKVIDYNNSFSDRFNAICDDFADLAGGKKSNGITVRNSDSKLGSLFTSLKSDVKSDSSYYEEWKNEIENTIQGNSNPSQYSSNLLYQVYCYKEIIGAENENYLNWHSNYGKLGNWNPKYRMLMKINDLQTDMKDYYDEISKQLNDKDNSIIKQLEELQELIRGGEGFLGSHKEGISEVATNAKDSRDELINLCDSMPDNDMAAGMKDEYSFSATNYDDPNKVDLKEVDSGNIQFVGDFDYEYLAQQYEKNKEYLNKLKELLELDKAVLESQIQYLNSIERYLVTYIGTQLDNLNNFANGSGDGNMVIWNFELYISNDTALTYDLLFDDSNIIYKDHISVENELGLDKKWFKITDGKGTANPRTQNYTELWKILVSWYGEGGSSQKKDAKTKVYKDLLKTIKEIIGPGDAGQSLIESFDGVRIPDCIQNGISTEAVKEQNLSSLFGDDGDFTGDVRTEASERNGSYYLTKLLMMDYDWHFFTNATFDKHPDKKSGSSEEDKKDEKTGSGDNFEGKTLKGEKITDKTNYLVNTVTPDGEDPFLGGAELEYIYWGNRDAQGNLKAVRTQITIIRAVENFASTYSIKEINNAIATIRNALAGIPIAALIVPPLIRAAIAMAETYLDLQALYEGKSIALYKSELSHMTLMQNIQNNPTLKNAMDSLFTQESGGSSPLNKKTDSSSGKEPIKFNYSQFVILCTMLFCNTDTIVERTQNLVELNMNYRIIGNKESINNANELDYKLSKASVSVKATCSIDQMNLLILGGVLNQDTVDDYLGSGKTEILNDGFSYTVIRTY